MYILNIASTIKKVTINELKDFIYEKYYKRVGFNEENETQKKDLLSLATKLTEKMYHANNTKEYYQSLLKKDKIN